MDKVLAEPAIRQARQELPHSLITEAVRAEVAQARETLIRDDTSEAPTAGVLAERAAQRAWLFGAPSLRPVINATGVVIHTNLGRAPLSKSTITAVAQVAGYSNLEYSLDEGKRGSRYVHAAQILRRVTGCEDALVVNNNAAALVLVLSALAAGKEVVLSRGMAVEIGGGFRIPDVMRQSGAKLVEIGTTNRTYARDYAAAINTDTAILMRVHASNFRIIGFTESPTVEELAALAHERGLLMVDDVGSGALLDTARYGMAPEPTVQASLQAGADLVLFSGDKLLGGPQCGIVAGNGEIVARLKKHPLMRALRVDKLTLAALEATLGHYLREEAERAIPVWRMIAATPGDLEARARSIANSLNQAAVTASVQEGQSTVGGGSLPGETLPTWLVSIKQGGGDAGEISARLRKLPVPIIGRIEEGALLLDPRTLLEGQEEVLVQGVIAAFTSVE